MKKLLYIFSVAAILTSCKTKTVVNQPEKPIDTNAAVSNKSFIQNILKKSTFEQVKINSRIDVQAENNIPTLDATIYIENAQKVWMNISAFLINVARGIATPTGIKAYEKYNKTYIDSDFAYLNKLLNVNFVDYNSLQNLLVGKTFIPINEKDFELTQNAQGYTLASKQTQKIVSEGKVSEYNVSLDYSSNLDLNKVLLKNIKTGDNLEVTYANWENFGQNCFPKNVKIIIKGQKTSQILIENTKFDFLKMETPYSVPNNYTKTEIK